MDQAERELLEAKQALRATARAARRDLTPAERGQRSRLACDRLVALAELRRVSTVLAYVATEVEADPAAAARVLAGRGVRVLLPRVRGEQLELAAATSDRLILGPFGNLEPVGPSIDASAVDAVVVPGVAFDRAGARLGQGGGHYDRLLATLREDAVRIGFAFSCQMSAHVPRQEHDQTVDLVVTDAAVHRVRQPPPTPA